MMKPADNMNELITCPYNASHQILPARFQVHLSRCRKSHPLSEKVTCPFNVTHRMNKEELSWHVTICVDRQSFENYKHRDPSSFGNSSSTKKSLEANKAEESRAEARETNEIECSEDWDVDTDVPSYNPRDYVEKAAVLRMPVGLLPAQRVAFRIAERKRLLAMEECKE